MIRDCAEDVAALLVSGRFSRNYVSFTCTLFEYVTSIVCVK